MWQMSEVLQLPSCWKGKWQIPTKQRNPIWDGIRVKVRKKVPLLHHLPLSSPEGNFTTAFWSHCKELTQLGTPCTWDKTGKCTPAVCLMHRTMLQADQNNNPGSQNGWAWVLSICCALHISCWWLHFLLMKTQSIPVTGIDILLCKISRH